LVPWVIHVLGRHREVGRELGNCCPPAEEVGGSVWVLPIISHPRWWWESRARCGGITCPACSACIKRWLLIKAIEKFANQKYFIRAVQFCT